MSRSIYFIVIWLINCSFAVGQNGTDGGYLSIGFASSGNLIIPIAEFSDSTWKRVQDMSIFDEPPMDEWYLYYASGKIATIRSTQIVMDVENHDAYIGLETSYAQEKWNPNYSSNANLAFTDNVNLVRFSLADTLAYQYLHAELATMLEKTEDEIISDNSNHRYESEGVTYVRGIPAKDSLRAIPKLTVEINVADKLIQGKELMYFKAEKRYRWHYPTLRGWIIKEGDDYKYVSLPGEELFYMNSFENKAGGSYGFHGAFEWEGSILLITGVGTWASFEYDLLEYKNNKMRFLMKDPYLKWVHKVYEELTEKN